MREIAPGTVTLCYNTIKVKDIMLIIPRSPKPISYEIISNCFLNGILIKSKHNNKITLIQKNMIKSDGSLTRTAIRKLSRSKFTQGMLDRYKKMLCSEILRSKRKRLGGVVLNFHKNRLNDYTHEIKITTDAKHSKNRICVYSDTLGKPLFDGLDPKNALSQNMGEVNAVKKAIEIAVWVKRQFSSRGDRVLLTVKTDCKAIIEKNNNYKGVQLKSLAKAANLGLNLKWIPGKSNKADPYTSKNSKDTLDLISLNNINMLKPLLLSRCKKISQEKEI